MWNSGTAEQTIQQLHFNGKDYTWSSRQPTDIRKLSKALDEAGIRSESDNSFGDSVMVVISIPGSDRQIKGQVSTPPSRSSPPIRHTQQRRRKFAISVRRLTLDIAPRAQVLADGTIRLAGCRDDGQAAARAIVESLNATGWVCPPASTPTHLTRPLHHSRSPLPCPLRELS